MRLHRLELSAFLAFPGTEVVDFDALGESGLFLMQGRTGAGKTALLDAVCFAFYGEVPGARHDGGRLRSDHAPPDVRTEVTLEATVRGRRVRITRSPEQERPKLRGEGITTEPHRVRVVAIADDGAETALATRHDEARAELGDLLGLTKDQFCQVVLLPQGGFAEFLQAKSDDRERLLRELFDVGRFASVERWLRDRKNDAREAAELALQAVRETLARAAQVADAEMPDPAGTAEELTEWVQEQLVVAEASAATAQQACADAGARRERAYDALVKARELAALQAEHARAVAELAEWESGRAAHEAAEAELAAARRAAPAQALVQALALRAEEARGARETAAAAVETARRAGVETEETPVALRAAAAEMRRTAGAVESLAGRERALEDAEREVQTLRRAAREHRAAAQAAGAEIAAARERRPDLDSALKAAADAAAALPGLRALAETARGRAAQGAERDRLIAELEPAKPKLLAAREAAVAAREEHSRLLGLRLAGIAAELAGRLADGEPCSVCGATEHPAPASAPAGGVVTADAVDEAERAVAARERERDDLADEVRRLEEALAAARAIARDDPLPELQAAASDALQRLEASERAAAESDSAKRALSEADAAIESAARLAGEADVAAAKAETEAAERAAALEDDRVAVIHARGGAASIAERVAVLVRRADAADAAAEAVERAAAAAGEEAAARERAGEAARAAGFAQLDDLQSALRGTADCDSLEREVRAWEAGLAERRTAAAREALVAAAELPAPDVAALEAAAAEAGAAAEQAQGDVATSTERRGELDVLRGRLDAALAVAGPAQARATLVRQIADLAAGAAAAGNRLRMPLTAYVLAARLEEVAAAATVRLQRMSDGRYSLEHADDAARRGRHGGLDLRVVDAWTGRDRLPSSLSGGETFLASLALALGLADVVTAEAGGARLETLFVDEGFGSLDDEGTLDEAISVLDSLRDGGRVVGIVSHVAELRQRIPVQLRVEKGRDGSRVAASVSAPV